MSIPKKGGKRANTAYEKSERRDGFVAPKSTTRNPRVTTVIHFMSANLERRISLPDLAEVARLSPTYLCHLFKAQTGLSPGEYLRRLRMEKASHLLTTTLLSIKEITAMVGYTSNFVRHFRKYFEFTPSEYRQRNYKPPIAPAKRKPE